MNELVTIVDSLENKVSMLLNKLELLKKENFTLQEELSGIKKEQLSVQTAVVDWEEKYNSLKLANSMLGGKTDKTEAKLKINTLIRELDICIAHLAE